MNRNIFVVVLAVLIVSLVLSVSTFAAKTQPAPKTNFKSIEEMHENCTKDPQMRKMMKEHMGEDWEKHHEEMGDVMKNHMGNSSMMGGTGSGMMSGGSMM